MAIDRVTLTLRTRVYGVGLMKAAAHLLVLLGVRPETAARVASRLVLIRWQASRRHRGWMRIR